MTALAHLLLITALSIPTPALVLRSGQRLDVDGSVQLDRGRVTFRSHGALYSLAETEVDLEATRAAGTMPPAVKADTSAARLKVSEAERTRLLKELEQNHSGSATPTTSPAPPPPTIVLPASEQPPGDEWSWRQQAQAHEETIRRAREELDLLTTKAEQLKSHIASLISLGYKPHQFSYDSTQLQYTLDAIPHAELEVTRAERAYAQFRDNARKMAVPPGWLR